MISKTHILVFLFIGTLISLGAVVMAAHKHPSHLAISPAVPQSSIIPKWEKGDWWKVELYRRSVLGSPGNRKRMKSSTRRVL